MRTSRVQAWAWVYAALFAFIALLGHVPGVNDAQGRTFGLFHLTPYQDFLHGLSGLWAALAAWRSPRQSTIYMRLFGTLYFLDGVVGAIVGQTFLDFGIFTGVPPTDPSIRVLVNVPHILIGGIAMLVGFVFAKRWQASAAA